ncbi:MAG TPA: PLP-dependent aminotransferase family protein [Chloroflexota bacterium]|nr:PLP-dependent aminotransferase family protein [Chloroflexota bacterium]
MEQLALRAGGAPLHRQIYEQVRRAVLAGRLPAGARLPATRALAERLGVARITVARAYDDLAAAGFVEGRRGSGTYVTGGAGGAPAVAVAARPRRLSSWARRALGGEVERAPDREPPRYDFRPGTPDWEAFPRRVWWRIVGRRLREGGGSLQRYGDPAGYLPLREAIARHVAVSRAVVCRPEQVVIVNGAQQAIDLLARLLLEAGDRVVVEDPGYPEARSLFAAYGAELRPVPVDAAGLDVERLPVEAARLVYVTPSHQFPTGVTLALERRLRLLAWAEAHDALVVEDDYDSEFRYAGTPVESLQGLDRAGRVIYVGTFSTVLFPPLRVGYVVLPPDLVAPFVQAKWLADRGTGALEQQALADFLAEGHFARHLRRMRRLGSARRDALLAALRRGFGDSVELPPGATGMHLMVRLPGVDATALARTARRRGVGVYPAAPYYAGSARRPDPSALLLGFGALGEAAIDEGVRRLTAAAAVAIPPRPPRRAHPSSGAHRPLGVPGGWPASCSLFTG